MPALLNDLLPLLLLGAAAVLFATWYLSGRWQSVLTRMEAALLALQQGQFQRINLHGAADTPRAVAQSYNLAMSVLENKWSAQQQLAEIDRLLLEAAGLEQSIEPILLRICALTASQFAAVALLDRDAPGHARSFVAGADGVVCPVNWLGNCGAAAAPGSLRIFSSRCASAVPKRATSGRSSLAPRLRRCYRSATAA